MMARIWRVYRAEMTKALRQRLTYLGPALVTATVLCMVLVRPVTRDGASDYAFIAYATPVSLNLLGLLLLLTYCAGLVSPELANGSICLALVRPVRRREYILAKVLVGMSYAAALTACVALSSWAVIVAFGDLKGVTFGAEVVYTSTDMIAAYAAGVVLALLPQCAAAAYAVMISSFTRSSAASIGGAVGIWVMADVVKHPLHVAPFLFSTYLETPWKVFTGRCDGLDPRWFPDATYLAAVSIVSLIVFTSVAIFTLSRRDLHA